MKALPFPCIRPAQDRVLEALPAMGSILSGNDALRGAIADGLMLKDPGAAYYVYECSGEPGRVTGVVAICPTSVLAGGKGDASADVAAAARAIAELTARLPLLGFELMPYHSLGAAKCARLGRPRQEVFRVPEAAEIDDMRRAILSAGGREWGRGL